MNRWQDFNRIPICYILSLIDHTPLWKIEQNKVNNSSTKKEVYQFQVACVSYQNLRKNKAFKDQIDAFFPNNFMLKRQNI